MRALRLEDDGARLVECDAPVPDGERAVVRVRVAGICNTDLEIVKGYMGFRGVLGHEFVGVVEEGPDEWRGQRVVGEINFACRSCPTCRANLERHCPSRRVMGILDADGAFADFVSVPVANLHRVPDGMADEVAVFCEPLAAAYEILEQIRPEPGSDAVVFGDGKLGLLVAQVLDEAGARVLAVGRHAPKLAILAARGIETVHADDWVPRRAPLVVEATGSHEGFARALAATEPRGALVLKSTLAEGASLDLAPVVIDEIRVLGSRCGPFPPALRALEADDVDVRSLVSERVPLKRALEGLERAAAPGVLKVLIDVADG